MSDTDIGARLAEIVEAAAGVILPIWRTGVTVETKSDESPVTVADQRGEALILEQLALAFPDTPVIAEEAVSASGAPPKIARRFFLVDPLDGTKAFIRGEALILEQLAKAFPDVPVVAEEAVSASGAPPKIARRFFLVDPLDGTKAFIRGEAHYTVNIGLIEDGVPVAGAVCAPATGESWFTAGGRALKRQIGERGGSPVHVRKADPADLLALSSHTLKPEQLAALEAKYGFTRRQPMDSSIKFCIIAEGGADLYPRHGTTMEWDIAAGHAVLVAAGGRVTTPDGEPFVYGKASEGFKNGWFVARGG